MKHVEIYRQIASDCDYFVNSFQKGIKERRAGTEIKHRNADWTGYAYPSEERRDSVPVINQFNQAFDTNFSDVNFPFGNVYLILEPGFFTGHEDRSTLYSYGSAHFSESRPSWHYFHVIGEQVLLEQTVDSFREQPKRLSEFVTTVFDWKNTPREGYDQWLADRGLLQVDLFSKMKKLFILDIVREVNTLRLTGHLPKEKDIVEYAVS